MAKELKLDTSDLVNYTSPDRRLLPPDFSKGKDNFAGKYCELLRSTGLKGAKIGSSRANLSDRDLAGKYVDDVNSMFESRRCSICLGLHEYLVEHNGEVGCWPGSKEIESYSIDGDPSKTEYNFDYFGADYKVIDDDKKGFYVSAHGGHSAMEYRNCYKYPKPEPPESPELTEMNREREQVFSGEVNAAKESIREAKKSLELEAAHSRVKGFLGLLLSLIWVLIWVLPCIHPFHPVDCSFMQDWLSGINGWINGADVPGWVRLVLTVLGYIPVILIYVLSTIEQILLLFMDWMVALGVVWQIAGMVLCAALCLVGLAILNVYYPAWDLVRPSKRGQFQKEIDEAEKALRDVKREQTRLKEEFAQRPDYKRLQEQHTAKLKAYEKDKAMNEAFAELWQRAWYDFIISAQ